VNNLSPYPGSPELEITRPRVREVWKRAGWSMVRRKWPTDLCRGELVDHPFIYRHKDAGTVYVVEPYIRPWGWDSFFTGALLKLVGTKYTAQIRPDLAIHNPGATTAIVLCPKERAGIVAWCLPRLFNGLPNVRLQ
jgi:hypothetical protein